MGHAQLRLPSRRSFLSGTSLAVGALVLGRRAASGVTLAATTVKPTDIAIKEVQLAFEAHDYRTPYQFGGSVVDQCVLLNVTLRAERTDGRSAEGFGSMPLGNVWAFPPRYVPVEQSLAAMKRLADEVVNVARDCDDRGHALDLSTALLPEWLRRAARISREMGLARPIPKLCTLVVVSALDAALHDAYGKVNGVNAYDALGREYVHHDLSRYLDDRFKGRYLDAYTLREPKPFVSIFHSISALDQLSPAEITKPIGDGLPETLAEWIERDGLTHFKIKLNGADLKADVDRVLAIERITAETQRKRGVKTWAYCADFNERCPNVDYVLEFCAKVQAQIPAALERIEYLEQPTDRDLRAHPENKMHAAAKIKPVVIDESLTDFETLLVAREQGYTGLALKACKGITEALLMAAAGQELKMFLTVQDLTCPGASYLESAGLTARIPGVTAMEANAREYCPSANRGWDRKYPEVFTVRDGRVQTRGLTLPGLGH